MSWLSIDAPAIGYVATHPVLREVSLRVARGECLAILGGNGAGKTVLLRYIAGLLPAGAGRRTLGGASIAGPRDAMRLGIGWVAQDPDDQLLGATVQEDAEIGPRNLRVPQAEIDARVRDALRQVELGALAQREIETLSLGERKRASLAGVLAMRPQMWLLDEPTAGIDPRGELELCASLRSLRASGATLIVATHAVDLVPLFATRVALVAEGRLLADGRCSEVLSDAGLLARARVRRPWPAELWACLDASDGDPAPPLTLEELARRLRGRTSESP
jgi:cobalt/nickel transport system ATP-binding protein